MIRRRYTTILWIVALLIVIMGCSPKPEFDRKAVLAASEQAAVPSLPEDYDTDTEQVRHLSWGKINYFPQEITVKAGKKVKLVGDTARLQGCFRSFTIPDLDVNGQFTESNNVLEFTPSQPGTFGFGCSMGMGNGFLKVE